MFHRLAIATVSTTALWGVTVSHAQTENGPGGYVYEYQSPSITLVKPEGWKPAEPEPQQPETLRPIMPSDLYEDPDMQQAGSLDDVIGIPSENALGPVLAQQRAKQRRALMAAAEAEKEAERMAQSPEMPAGGVDAQTTAALPDGETEDQAGAADEGDTSSESGVEIIRGDAAAAASEVEEPANSNRENPEQDPAPEIVEVPEENDPATADSEAAAADGPTPPEFSDLEMRL
ncbi:hypothetical protein [Notoacmeibacter ruber]|uniref:Uncharacterized protein n=1 Tax=Notoacmeibacter ruber TaxID=2670375 RepID=A0A3L7JAB1_9HYPH|nr:hypothetical protein [Notoacmeibacter ruber]RLQ87430.1 hypothetical protein D8780_03630 [Notoacmeibacter ruber]